MKLKLLCIYGLFFLSFTPDLKAESPVTAVVSLNRSLEIRYIAYHPENENFVMVEGKKYLVFNSREDAVNYGENMSVKYDLTIVYVRTENEKDKEIIELSK